jgi:hypothetical protein
LNIAYVNAGTFLFETWVKHGDGSRVSYLRIMGTVPSFVWKMKRENRPRVSSERKPRKRGGISKLVRGLTFEVIAPAQIDIDKNLSIHSFKDSIRPLPPKSYIQIKKEKVTSICVLPRNTIFFICPRAVPDAIFPPFACYGAGWFSCVLLRFSE